MKKVAFILASLLVIMFAGCGEGSSSSAASSVSDTTTNTGTSTNVVTDVKGLTEFPAVPALPES